MGESGWMRGIRGDGDGVVSGNGSTPYSIKEEDHHASSKSKRCVKMWGEIYDSNIASMCVTCRTGI